MSKASYDQGFKIRYHVLKSDIVAISDRLILDQVSCIRCLGVCISDGISDLWSKYQDVILDGQYSCLKCPKEDFGKAIHTLIIAVA